MSMLLLTARHVGDGRVAFSIEAGANGMKELRNMIKHQRASGRLWANVSTFQFNEKADIPAIQTADIIAYETAKRIRDLSITGAPRPLRKSLNAVIGENDNHKVAVLNASLLKRSLRVLSGAWIDR